jgi:citrate synthase
MYGRIGRQKMLAEIYKECGSIFGKGNTPMTDKQIIIDGVDVSGCEFYNKVIGEDAYCNIDEEHLCTCISYENCYYKKLKAKEQECEAYKMEAEEGKEINAELKAEIKSLRNDFEKNDVMAASMIQALQKEKTDSTNMFLDKIGQLNTENYKLKQTLAEIKPILELYANSKIGEEQPDGTYKLSGGIWDSFGFCATTYDPRPAREGLKKISEVE